jgi:hypothetical protein
MRRITPDEVKAAYEKTGLKPGRGCYADPYTNVACGLGVMARAEGGNRWWAWIDESTQDNRSYHYGFVNGFDGLPIHIDLKDSMADAELGHQDGQAAAAAVFQES